jgi:vancomycin resistance protein YoaR
VEKDVSAYNIEPVNATIKRKNGEFIYGDHVVGKKVNVDATVQEVAKAIDGWNRQDIVVDAVIEDDLPIYTKDIVEQCNTIVGTYTTQYVDSAEGRAANLANGARLINNAVLYPGDVFSAYEYLTPFTEDNGYFVAGAYLQGKVIDSVGGGACQVTTTLYNAILQAELEVVERQPHSMTISYVDLSRDAAIAGTYKDFKFKNNTDVPILIEATTKGRTITFKVWGKETRDTKKREVEYVTVVLSETKPPADVITKDPSQPETYRKVTQSAHTGYKAELYKVVKENGVEVSRTLVNKSNYAAAPKYITIGTKKVEVEKKPDDKDKPKDTDKEEEQQDQSDIPTDSQATIPDNGTNPEGQIQADIWNDFWDEGYED